MISGKISGKPIRALRLGCKVHGAAVVVVQDAMRFLPRRVAQADLKHLN